MVNRFGVDGLGYLAFPIFVECFFVTGCVSERSVPSSFFFGGGGWEGLFGALQCGRFGSSFSYSGTSFLKVNVLRTLSVSSEDPGGVLFFSAANGSGFGVIS